jgi:hypothetical protein
MEETLGSLDKEQLTRLAQYFDEKVMSIETTKLPEISFCALLSEAGAQQVRVART